jgi:hypothetical protein
MLFFFLQKNHKLVQTHVLARLAAIFDLLAFTPFSKLFWGIVHRYVTPPLAQLVFVLVVCYLHI